MRSRRRPPTPSVAGSDPAEQVTLRLRHVVALVAAGLGLLGALLAGWWGLGTARGEDGPQAAGWVQVENGWVRVDEVVDRSLSHRRMTNMQTMPDADPVPDGHVRYLVQLSIAAEGRTLRWRPADLRVSGTGMPPTPPHGAELGDGLVPAGSTVRGSVTVDVPEDATNLVLTFGDARVALSTEPGAHGSDHGDGDSHEDDTDDGDGHEHDTEVPHGSDVPTDRDH
ncbi:MAG: hypothetical protein ACLGH4_07120 [Actinomycetes bacterium]